MKKKSNHFNVRYNFIIEKMIQEIPDDSTTTTLPLITRIKTTSEAIALSKRHNGRIKWIPQ